MSDVFTRIKDQYTPEDLAHFEQTARDTLSLSPIPACDVDDYLIAIIILKSMADRRIIDYAMKLLREQQAKADEWPDEICEAGR